MSIRLATACACALALSACQTTAMLDADEIEPIRFERPLVQVADQRLAASLDWVLVRNDPGSWAENAYWDEYLLRLRSLGTEPVQVTGVTVVDKFQNPHLPLRNREALARATRDILRYYNNGWSAGAVPASGKAVAATGVGAGLGVGGAAALSTASSTYWAGMAEVAGAAAFLSIAPPLIIVGTVRGVRNRHIDRELAHRSTPLPLAVATDQPQPVDLFFPITPAPLRVTITYTDADGEHTLDIDTRQALAGLHLVQPATSAADSATD